MKLIGDTYEDEPEDRAFEEAYSAWLDGVIDHRASEAERAAEVDGAR